MTSADGLPAQVLTVSGLLRATELGVTDAHDHLALRSPALAGQEFDDADKAIEEVREAQAGGLQSIVEVTPIGLGRNPALMRRVADETGDQRHRRDRLPPRRALPGRALGLRRVN